MAIDFKEKFATLQSKDVQPLTQDELGYIGVIETYIDSQIESKLSTDNYEVWIDKNCVEFNYNPVTKKPFPQMTRARKSFLRDEILARYENANWLIKWHIDDGLDGPNMSGNDYLILIGKLK